MNNKSQIFKVTAGIGVFLACLYYLYKFKGPDVSQDMEIPRTESIDTTISEQDTTIDVVQDIQESYDVKIQELQDSIITLKFKLYDYESKITDTKNKSDEKVNTIISNDANQLVQFLSNRYKDSIR